MCQMNTCFNKKKMVINHLGLPLPLMPLQRTTTVYKMVVRNGKKFVSFIDNTLEWRNGLMCSNRYSTTPSGNEKRTKEVNRGFHFFMNKKDAQKLAKEFGGTVITCTVDKYDIVGRGSWDFQYTVPTLVAIKCMATLPKE